MWKQRLGDMNDNGESFADLCATNNLVIDGSVFNHIRIYKDTKGNLSVTRPVNGEPDRPPVHHMEFSSLSSG
ncbi:hypothetical protein DPMN_008477 [Dreissena polymorpha]|uniref:Uncharacterized protein n=1 Tax=Dreissena polymorpha TaxID=45954 RepID=A0A9D4MXU9_DREPO|nr:hypothetical protein DPMN_008477 [Dreissena polymorpha]